MRRRPTRLAATTVMFLLFGVAACTGESGQFIEGVSDPTSPPPPPIEVTLSPRAGATDVPLSAEIGIEAVDAEVTSVTLRSERGESITGSMRADGTSWVPDQALAPETTYTAAVAATADEGHSGTIETTFTTMPEPANVTHTGLYMFDGSVYGVAMPVVVEFVQPVPEEARADVQRRLFVTTDPPQPGVWSWVPDGRQVFYRAPEYWQPGTTIDVRVGLRGHPTGDGRYGDTDRRATAFIGDKTMLEVDNAHKQMSVYVNDELIRQIPVSLGKPSTPSSYGQMVVMSKERETIFDTYEQMGPDEGYRMDIEYAMRLTWGGEYIHAAPWSVDDQGVRNVSHGCVNLSMSNAEWLFDTAKIGDPVTVIGTERPLRHGNGWTAWNLSWDDFIAGSALPLPEQFAS